MLVMTFDTAARTHAGRRRRLNEDALLAAPDQRLWVVADGMGGHDAGDVASAMIVEALSVCGVPAREGAVLEALQQVNAALIALARAAGPQRMIGSTVAGLVADGSHYLCFWAGDSRVYLLRDGALTRLTRDHSLVQELVDAGMLDARDAETHPNANVITRAVGTTDALVVDTVGGMFQPGDLFLIASDGLTRLVGDDELRNELQAPDLAFTADELVNLVLLRGAPDNVSLILVRVQPQAAPFRD